MDRTEFHHPFTPYDIQLQFMQALYACLENGKVAVFESPTGERARLCFAPPGLFRSDRGLQVLYVSTRLTAGKSNDDTGSFSSSGMTR